MQLGSPAGPKQYTMSPPPLGSTEQPGVALRLHQRTEAAHAGSVQQDPLRHGQQTPSTVTLRCHGPDGHCHSRRRTAALCSPAGLAGAQGRPRPAPPAPRDPFVASGSSTRNAAGHALGLVRRPWCAATTPDCGRFRSFTADAAPRRSAALGPDFMEHAAAPADHSGPTYSACAASPNPHSGSSPAPRPQTGQVHRTAAPRPTPPANSELARFPRDALARAHLGHHERARRAEVSRLRPAG